jgi:hypothetical protein
VKPFEAGAECAAAETVDFACATARGDAPQAEERSSRVLDIY